MIPAAAAVDVGPVLDLTRLRDQQRDAVRIHRMRFLPVDLDGPRERHVLRAVRRALAVRPARVAVAGAAELDKPRAHRRDDRDLHGERVRDLADVRRGREVGDAGHVDARHRTDDTEFEHRPDHRIVVVALQGFAERQRVLRTAAVFAHLEQVDELEPRADREGREVDHDIVAFRAALMIERVERDRIDDEVAVIGDELECRSSGCSGSRCRTGRTATCTRSGCGSDTCAAARSCTARRRSSRAEGRRGSRRS